MKPPTVPARGLVSLALLGCVLLPPTASRAQTVVWAEGFENGCTATCLAADYVGPNGAWSVEDVNAPGTAANTWYVSCAENGQAAGECGAGCAGNATLHVGNVPASPAAFLFCPSGDCGAAYDSSGATVVADKRAVSPTIDLTGASGPSLSLLYLAAGEPCDDAADLEYSADDGGNWEVLAACLQGDNVGCFGQGRWTSLTVDLPPSAEDNPRVRLALRWRNDGDFMGRDPSFAVDELSVQVSDDPCGPPQPLGIDLFDDLRVAKSGDDAALDWSLAGPLGPPATHYHVYRSTDPSLARPDGWGALTDDAPVWSAQQLFDPVLSDGRNHYYDVRAVDDCENEGL